MNNKKSSVLVLFHLSVFDTVDHSLTHSLHKLNNFIVLSSYADDMQLYVAVSPVGPTHIDAHLLNAF